MNPFLTVSNLPFEAFNFDLLKNEHYLPAIDFAIQTGKKEIEAIVSNTENPTFENTIESLENSGKLIDLVSTIFFNLHETDSSDELEELASIISPKLTEYSNDILLNKELFERIDKVFTSKENLNLSTEQETLLDKTYKNFIRNGAKLSEIEKEKLRAIDIELAETTLKFGNNVLKENNSFELFISNQDDLDGLPESTIEAAAATAIEKGHKDGWVITLDYPSYIPFMTYSTNRELKKQLFIAFGSKAFKNNEFDNQSIVKKIASLRHERALLLGYSSHSNFVLEERMAKTPETVKSFLENLLNYALPSAKKELDELTAYSQSINGPAKLERWDIPYYSEKLKKERFSIDDEALKPYFKIENVINGVFKTAEKLYGLTFIERDDIPKYHPEVITYEVKNSKNEHLSLLYMDFFPRGGKRQGAWMTSFRNQSKEKSKNIRPHISIVCNFTKSTPTKPSLLTFNEVTTLFHEFGHALHGMCADGTYQSISGTNVYWDFVELPSQILENWCYEKDCLDLFAKHYLTNEPIPTEYITKIKESSNFLSGLATLRQLSFGLLDIAWHSQSPTNISNIKEFEIEQTAKTDIYPIVNETSISCSFSHIFQGGYSSGYYSYKWAEVIEADAFEAFLESGVFNTSIATKFYDCILSKGGSEHPSILYKKFRGRDADPKALLRREGLLSEVE
jgi:Zn-dependent oligopeptidase